MPGPGGLIGFLGSGEPEGGMFAQQPPAVPPSLLSMGNTAGFDLGPGSQSWMTGGGPGTGEPPATGLRPAFSGGIPTAEFLAANRGQNGFFTLADRFAQQPTAVPYTGPAGQMTPGKSQVAVPQTVPPEFSQGANLPSTNNFNLLPYPYNIPGYVMRNGHIVDTREGQSEWAPGVTKFVNDISGGGALLRRPIFGNPISSRFGFPAVSPYSFSQAGAFFPGQQEPQSLLDATIS